MRAAGFHDEERDGRHRAVTKKPGGDGLRVWMKTNASSAYFLSVAQNFARRLTPLAMISSLVA